MALFGSSSSSAAPATSDPEQAQIKAEVLKQLQTQAAIANAKALIGVRAPKQPNYSTTP